MAKLRLNKILAQAGLSSRRGADRLIADGRVAINGAVSRELGTLADPERDLVTVDGRPLPRAETKQYLVLHKPAGYVTSVKDPRGRPVVADLVSDVDARLYPVGRLDWDVEGALLMTNDGALTHRLLHPRYGLPRVYEADVEGRVAPGALERWRRGVVLDDGPARPLEVELLHGGRDGTLVRLTFAEGRKHEVKRYCAAATGGSRRARFRRCGRPPKGRPRPVNLPTRERWPIIPLFSSVLVGRCSYGPGRLAVQDQRSRQPNPQPPQPTRRGRPSDRPPQTTAGDAVVCSGAGS